MNKEEFWNIIDSARGNRRGVEFMLRTNTAAVPAKNGGKKSVVNQIREAKKTAPPREPKSEKRKKAGPER
jgi:hypothetical protein